MTNQQLTDKRWLDDMIIELRLRHISGTAIGDSVAEVENHCSESGESFAEAFGDPREYARALDFRPAQLSKTSAYGWGKTLIPVAAGMIAINLVPTVVRALFADSAVQVSWGELSGFVIFALVVGFSITFLQALLHNKVAGILFFGGAVTVMAMLPILLPATAFTLPTIAAITIGAISLAVSVIGMWRQHRLFEDPIVDPRIRRRPTSVMAKMTIWLFPLAALFLALLTAIPLWLTH